MFAKSHAWLGSWGNWTSQLTKDCQPSDCTEEHYVSLPGMEHMSVELRKNIWLFIYMAQHWMLPNRLINIPLHIHIRVYLWLAIWCIMTCIMIVSHTNRLENFSQSPCTVPSCRYILTLIVLHPPGWDCVAVCIPLDKWSANERRPYMAAGGGMVYWKKWIRLWDAKKHTIKAFWLFKGDLISQMNSKVLSLWRE